MLKYIDGYPDHIKAQAQKLITQKRLGEYLLTRYPVAHEITTDKNLYRYVVELKNQHMRNSQPLSKVAYDPKIRDCKAALGIHTFVSRKQGGKLKAKNEILISHIFKKAPESFLRMIIAHELAHLKEKEHNKAFYKLCAHVEPNYHQLELDMRLYLIYKENFGELYKTGETLAI